MYYKAVISYDGTNYHGFQEQGRIPTIERTIKRALHTFTKNEIKILSSGRTDKGVHALKQVICFKLDLDISPNKLKAALNHNLNKDIRVLDCSYEVESFHPRFCAKQKEYRYYINYKHYDLFKRQYELYWENIDIDLMKIAINDYVGKHDFRAFTKLDFEKNTTRTIFTAELTVINDIIELRFVGNGFLKYMVRAMVGTLIEIATKKKTLKHIQTLLETKERVMCGFTAPPEGLYLYEVNYETK